MIVDLRSPKTRVVVGGQTLSNQFEELLGSDDYVVESGLVTFKGSLKLCEIWGGLSLDDWSGVEWLKLGTAIEIDINLGAGLVRHPRGKLYIQGTTYKQGSNSLEVACCLGARSFAEPVDETKIQGVTSTAIVNQLFQLAGCGLPVWNTSQSFNLCERPQIGGSYLQSAGKILASLGLFAFADGQGVVQIYPVEAAGLLMSINEPELSDLERVLVGSPPSSKALVSGSYRLCHDRPNPLISEVETRGNIAAIVPGGAGYGTTSRTITTDGIDYANSIVNRQKIGTRLGFQVYKGRSGLPKTSQVQSITQTGFTQYSRGADAKLEYSIDTTLSPAYQALQGYVDWAIENKKPVFLSTSVQAHQEIVFYFYDDREQLIEMVTETYLPIGSILASLGGVDWQKIDDAYGLPSEPILSERVTIQWILIAPGEWRKVTTREFSQCKDADGQAGLQERLNKAKDSEVLGIYDQAVSCSASTVTVEESNSGQANPPNAERFPTLVKTEAKQVEREVQFQGFSNSLDPRSKPYTCPHFPDVHGSESVNDFAYRYGAVWHGVALRRWQSVRVEMPYRSELLNYRPYAQIELATATGTYRLAMNGTSWAISPDKALVSSDCSLIGRVPSPGVVVVPFMPVPELVMRLGFWLGLQMSDYEPESATITANLGLRLSLDIVERLELRLGLRLPVEIALADDTLLALRLGLRLNLQAGYSAETTSWINRVQALGGDVIPAAAVAVEAFFTTAKTRSYWSKLKLAHLFAGTTTIASVMAPLKHPSNMAASNSGFGSSAYTNTGSGAGIQGDGSNYINHNFSPHGNSPGVSASLGTYSKTATGYDAYDVGYVLFNYSAWISISIRWTDGNFYSDILDAVNGRVYGVAPSGAGFAIGSRISANDSRYYFDGTQYSISTTTTPAMSSSLDAFYSFAGGAGFKVSPRKLVFSFAGDGLSLTEAADLTTDVNALVAAI